MQFCIATAVKNINYITTYIKLTNTCTENNNSSVLTINYYHCLCKYKCKQHAYKFLLRDV